MADVRHSQVLFRVIQCLMLCEVVYVEGVAKTFYFHTALGNANAAEETCSNYNAAIVTISNEREYIAMLKLLEEQPGFIPKHYWIGLFHIDNNNFSWACSDSAGINFVNWGDAEPDVGGSFHCVEVQPDNLWYLTSCKDSRKFICEKKEGSCVYIEDISFSTTTVTSIPANSLDTTLTECQTQCETLYGGESCYYILFGTNGECALFGAKPSGSAVFLDKYTAYSRECYSGVIRTEHVPYVRESEDPPNTRCPILPSLHQSTVTFSDKQTTISTDQPTVAETSSQQYLITTEAHSSTGEENVTKAIDTISIGLSSSTGDTSDNSKPATQLDNDATINVLMTPPDSALISKSETTEISATTTTTTTTTSREVTSLITNIITDVSPITVFISQPLEQTSAPLKQDDCYCTCAGQSYSDEEKETFIRKILEDLSLDKNNISAHARRLTSAPDPRPSAKAVGCIGLVLFATVIFSIVFLDFTTLIQEFKKIKENVRMLFGGNSNNV